MSKFLHTLAEGSNFISDSKAPVNLDGAHAVPVRGLLSQKIEAVERFARDPPFQLTDLVRWNPTFLPTHAQCSNWKSALTDAVKHINTGINDRDLLASSSIPQTDQRGNQSS
jgi:linoleate 10R-lipoxygenase